MPLIFQNAYRCEYPFLQTAQSVIHKYPNPHAKQVVSVDTIDATVSEDGSTLRLERILGIRQNAPKWVQRVCSPLLILAAETHYTDIMRAAYRWSFGRLFSGGHVSTFADRSATGAFIASRFRKLVDEDGHIMQRANCIYTRDADNNHL